MTTNDAQQYSFSLFRFTWTMLAKKQTNLLYFFPRAANTAVFCGGQVVVDFIRILQNDFTGTGHHHASEGTLNNMG